MNCKSSSFHWGPVCDKHHLIGNQGIFQTCLCGDMLLKEDWHLETRHTITLCCCCLVLCVPVNAVQPCFINSVPVFHKLLNSSPLYNADKIHHKFFRTKAVNSGSWTSDLFFLFFFYITILFLFVFVYTYFSAPTRQK